MQDLPCSNWKLLIELQFSESDHLPRPDLCASSIAEAVGILQSQNISVAICLTSEHGKQCPPEQHVLRLMAPCLQDCDLYSTSHLGPRPFSISCFSEGHLKVLGSAHSRLEKLSFSDHVLDLPLTPLYDVALIAVFSKLQKLHLTTCIILDFGPLAPLKCLQDLAILCHAPHDAAAANCSGVIESSGKSLRYLTLAAHKWRRDTYNALKSADKLLNLVVKVLVGEGLHLNFKPGLVEFVVMFSRGADVLQASRKLSEGNSFTSQCCVPYIAVTSGVCPPFLSLTVVHH